MKNVLILVIAGLLIQCQPKDTKTPVAVPPDFIKELWYKNDLIYNLDVDVFNDADGDGTGDFKGLTQKLDYLKNLGVDVIWLAPFQPTPNEDDGYDVSDFYGIDPHLGTRQDFDGFMQQSEKRGIRVIMDLVINHTSDQHPWFKAAQQSKTSPFRSWYIWSKERPADFDKGHGFSGVQTETWTLDKQAGGILLPPFLQFPAGPECHKTRRFRLRYEKLSASGCKQVCLAFGSMRFPFLSKYPARVRIIRNINLS